MSEFTIKRAPISRRRPATWRNLTSRNLPTGYMRVSMEIENRYKNHPDVTTYVQGAVIPCPPADKGTDEYSDWAYDNIYSVYTGTGRTTGDSWHDVEITACTDEGLVGRTFNWGY